jgi:hypothetical protein
VVEGTGLENRQTRKRLEGSNPSPSASWDPNILFHNDNKYRALFHPTNNPLFECSASAPIISDRKVR